MGNLIPHIFPTHLQLPAILLDFLQDAGGRKNKENAPGFAVFRR
jgi:hypothetical protein